MTPRERGKLLRRAVNYSIENDSVYYEKIGENRWEADVSYLYEIEYFSNEKEFGSRRVADGFEVVFVPDQIEYNGVHVFSLGDPWRVDWKTYCWAVRTLSQHMVMDKLGDGHGQEESN